MTWPSRSSRLPATSERCGSTALLSGNGWTELSSGTFTQVSGGTNAAGQAIVFGVLTDGSLWEQNPAGAGLNVDWTQRSGPGTVLSVTAGGSADEAFVIETDHHLVSTHAVRVDAAVQPVVLIGERHGNDDGTGRGVRDVVGLLVLRILADLAGRPFPPTGCERREEQLRRARVVASCVPRGRAATSPPGPLCACASLPRRP